MNIEKIKINIKKAVGLFLDITGIRSCGIRINGKELEYFEAFWRKKSYKVTTFLTDKSMKKGDISFSLSRLLQKKGGIPPFFVNVVIDGKGVFTKIITIPHVPKNKIKSSIMWEINQHLPFDVSKVIVDYQVMGESEEDGSKVWRVLFVASKIKAVEDSIKGVIAFGLRVKNVRYIPISLVNQYDFNVGGLSIAHVTIKGKNVLINIIENGELLFVNVSSPSDKKALMRHVIGVLKKFIEKRVSILERVVVTHGHDDVADEIMEQLNIFVTIEEKKGLVFLIDDNLFFNGHAPFVFSVLRHNVTDINLLPAIEKENNKNLRRKAYGSIIFSFLIFFLTAFYLYFSINTIKPSSNKLRSLQRVYRINRSMEEMDKKIKLLGSINRVGSSWSPVLAGLAKIINEKELYGKLWLRRLSGVHKGEGFIDGIAFSNRDVTIFLNVLEQFRPLKAVRLSYSKPIKINKKRCIKFRIEFGTRHGN